MFTERVGRGNVICLPNLGGIPDVKNVVVATRGELGTIRGPLKTDHFLGMGVLPAGEKGVSGTDITVDD